MSETEELRPRSEPKRRWFQIHLSTLLLLTPLAAYLISFNFNRREVAWYDGQTPYKGVAYGWPFNAFYVERAWGVLHGGSLDEPEFNVSGVIYNGLFLLIVLILLVISIERIARHFHSRKPPLS